MSLPLALIDKDPTDLGFPPTLPLELAAKTASVRTICEAYGIDRARYNELRVNPLFQRACEEAHKMIQAEGGAFKSKLRTMAEALLPRIWELATHSDLEMVPANVQAQLAQFAIRAAGLDASIEQKAAATAKTGGVGNALQININLG